MQMADGSQLACHLVAETVTNSLEIATGFMLRLHDVDLCMLVPPEK